VSEGPGDRPLVVSNRRRAYESCSRTAAVLEDRPARSDELAPDLNPA